MHKLAILSAIAITGCASPPICPGPEVVEIERVRYVPIPRYLLTFADVTEHEIVTNGDLLEAYKAWRAAAEERARLLDEVAKLATPKPPTR
jgi:hypothetical protein